MEITHTWKVRRLIQKNDGTGTVIQVFYKVHSTDGEYYTASSGNVELYAENIPNFVPYQNLTEELVVSWVKENLGPTLGNHEQLNTDVINSLKNPVVPDTKIENLPWEIIEAPVTPDPVVPLGGGGETDPNTPPPDPGIVP